MIRFSVSVNESKLKTAGYWAERYISMFPSADLPFTFNHTKDNLHDVRLKVHKAQEVDLTIEVKTYRPMWRRSKTIAYAEGRTIFVNEYKIPSLDVADYVGNFVHEAMHVLGYSHKGNRVTAYNLKTVPYAFGRAASLWFKQQ